jgi:hypothetical protein
LLLDHKGVAVAIVEESLNLYTSDNEVRTQQYNKILEEKKILMEKEIYTHITSWVATTATKTTTAAAAAAAKTTKTNKIKQNKTKQTKTKTIKNK